MKLKYLALPLLAVAVTAGIGSIANAQTDGSIESAVRKSFIYKHTLSNDDIKVESKDGVVTLTGTVAEDYHKTVATEAAAAQDGVKSVDDRLELKSPGPKEGSDAWLTAKVKTALLFHRSVSGLATKIRSKDGTVTLRGVARNQAEKDLTTEFAKDVDGVKDVRNLMTVAKGPSKTRRMEKDIDDASITAEVKLTLLFHRSTSALHTEVKTTHGVVTLSGKATSTAEKDLAEKLVGDIRGVQSVTNDITVQ
jgi:osmotically-inducible protein OsmY